MESRKRCNIFYIFSESETPPGASPALSRSQSEPAAKSGNAQTLVVQRSTTVSLLGGSSFDREEDALSEIISESRSVTSSGVGDEEDLLARFESGSVNSDTNSNRKGWVSASPADSGGFNRRESTSSSGSGNKWSSGGRNESIEELQREKKALHLVLKAYER